MKGAFPTAWHFPLHFARHRIVSLPNRHRMNTRLKTLLDTGSQLAGYRFVTGLLTSHRSLFQYLCRVPNERFMNLYIETNPEKTCMWPDTYSHPLRGPNYWIYLCEGPSIVCCRVTSSIQQIFLDMGACEYNNIVLKWLQQLILN